MNIDERLQALTQSVELLASFHKDNEKRLERLSTNMERMMTAMERVNGRGTQLESFVTQIAEGTARLLHIVEGHERRIDRLERDQT